MACETYKTVIDNKEYTFKNLPALKSVKVKLKLMKVLGEALPKLLKARGADSDIQISAFTSSLEDMLAGDNVDEIISLINEVLSTVLYDDKQLDVDAHFAGDLTSMYELLIWCLKKEYESFFVGMIGTLGAEPINNNSNG